MSGGGGGGAQETARTRLRRRSLAMLRIVANIGQRSNDVPKAERFGFVLHTPMPSGM